MATVHTTERRDHAQYQRLDDNTASDIVDDNFTTFGAKSASVRRVQNHLFRRQIFRWRLTVVLIFFVLATCEKRDVEEAGG